MTIGLNGVPFNLPAGNTPQPADLIFGGSMTAPQAGQSVAFSIQQILLALGNAPITTAAFNTAILGWWATLPTSLPVSAGIFWNNGGSLAIS